MSVDEFLLAFISIIIGLGVADLLVSFHRLLCAAPRVKWDWLTLSFAALMLFTSVVFWWFSYGWYHDVRSATIASFLPKILVLCLNFLMMAAALPDEVPTEGLDLRAFYLASKMQRWWLVTASIVVSIGLAAGDNWQLGMIVLSSYLWPSTISAALSVTCAYSNRIWLQVLAIGWIATVTCYYSLFQAVG